MKLKKAKDIKVGETVIFKMKSANYEVKAIEETKIGSIRHHHKTGSNSYKPDELLYVG